jgi:hypothetical protein
MLHVVWGGRDETQPLLGLDWRDGMEKAGRSIRSAGPHVGRFGGRAVRPAPA